MTGEVSGDPKRACSKGDGDGSARSSGVGRLGTEAKESMLGRRWSTGIGGGVFMDPFEYRDIFDAMEKRE